MPAYSFSKIEFVPMILDGRKPHTIRPRRKIRTKPGDLLYLYYKQRTKDCRAIGITVCEKIQPVVIYPYANMIKVNGRLLAMAKATKLARADGFTDIDGLMGFFKKNYSEDTLHNFELVEWDPKKLIKLWDMQDQNLTPQSFSTERWLEIWQRRFGGA